MFSEGSMRHWGGYPILLDKVLPMKTPAEGRWDRRQRAVQGVGGGGVELAHPLILPF